MATAQLKEKSLAAKKKPSPRNESRRERGGYPQGDAYLAEALREVDAIKQQIAALNRKLTLCHDQLVRRGYREDALDMLAWRREHGEGEANRIWALSAHYFATLQGAGK